MDGDAASGATLDVVARLERSMLTSWPALSMAFSGDWVIRFADGYTKRSNSVTCLSADDTDLDGRIDHIESLYQARRLPAIFRLSPITSPALDLVLHRRGWRRFDETLVMTADLSKLADMERPEVEACIAINDHADQTWMQKCQRIHGSKSTHLETLRLMLDRLVPPAGYGRLGINGRIDAMGMVVVDHRLAGLFEVMTVSEHRRKGLAQCVLQDLLRWANAKGATTAWLSVLADNLPAVRLYQGLGFCEAYRYYHRSNDRWASSP